MLNIEFTFGIQLIPSPLMAAHALISPFPFLPPLLPLSLLPATTSFMPYSQEMARARTCVT